MVKLLSLVFYWPYKHLDIQSPYLSYLFLAIEQLPTPYKPKLEISVLVLLFLKTGGTNLNLSTKQDVFTTINLLLICSQIYLWFLNVAAFQRVLEVICWISCSCLSSEHIFMLCNEILTLQNQTEQLIKVSCKKLQPLSAKRPFFREVNIKYVKKGMIKLRESSIYIKS